MIRKLIRIITHPLLYFRVFLANYLYPFMIKRFYRIVVNGEELIIEGKPLVQIAKGAKIILGDHVTLRSWNKGYHLNMHSPVKLLADRSGAMIEIGANSRINGACIHAYKQIKIGKNCLIAANTQIFDGSGHDLSFPDVENRIKTNGTIKPVIIEDNVWVGANCIILPGVTIGTGSVIAAGSIVIKDIPPMVIAGGNPAKVLKDCSVRQM